MKDLEIGGTKEMLQGIALRNFRLPTPAPVYIYVKLVP